MVKVGELVVLPMCMCVGVGWVVGLKTLTFLVLVLAVINESLRGCFMHFYTVAPRRAVHESRPVVNLIRLGSCGVWGHLLVLVCVGVDLLLLSSSRDSFASSTSVITQLVRGGGWFAS